MPNEELQGVRDALAECRNDVARAEDDIFVLECDVEALREKGLAADDEFDRGYAAALAIPLALRPDWRKASDEMPPAGKRVSVRRKCVRDLYFMAIRCHTADPVWRHLNAPTETGVQRTD